jgi:gluconate 2-dehydrogenase gamma chain
MDRRDSLKALALGSLGASALLTGCDSVLVDSTQEALTGQPADLEPYGRTAEEKAHDAKLMSETFFTPAELATITVLSDIILPADEHSGSASEAGVPAFIEFMAKDQPSYQTPLRGGLRWMELKSAKLYETSFTQASKAQQLELVEMIAYPEKAAPENTQGVSFFTLMRNLTATGFFTSKMGIEDLQYKGNTPNAWDGVPQEVLDQYGLAYDEKTLAQCLKNEERGQIMTWDNYPAF